MQTDPYDGMRERGVAVMAVARFMDEAERNCDRHALVNHGVFRALDTPESIAVLAGGSRVGYVPSRPAIDEALHATPGEGEIGRKGRYIAVTGAGDPATSTANPL